MTLADYLSLLLKVGGLLQISGLLKVSRLPNFSGLLKVSGPLETLADDLMSPAELAITPLLPQLR